MPGEVEQRVQVGDRHLLRPRGELDDVVASVHLALFEHAEVEAGAVVGDEQGGDPRVVHADPDPVAGDPGLRYLEGGGADLVAVADADLVIAKPFDGEVLAELSVDEVVSAELAFPVPIGVDLVDEHGALLAAVSRPIALTVALDVQLADAAGTADRLLEDACENGLPLPSHVLRHADIDRHQPARRLGDGRSRLDLLGPRAHAYAPGGVGSSACRMLPNSSMLRPRPRC